PQKGRYRQFMQCDIDVIGEPGILAEVELLVATIAALDALGLTGCTIRINDRRLLTSMLSSFGFSPEQYATVLITLDKLDKVGAEGVVAELRDRADDIARLGSQPSADIEPDIESAIDAVEAFLTRIRTAEFVAYGERAIRRELPDGVDEDAVADLVALGNAVEAAGLDRSLLQFDPFLVRGMGYYTGTIFEVAHPELGYSLGGGGRYDGMIGRFLGTDVPAAGISLGFERLVDLVLLSDPDAADAVALLYDADVPAARLASLKAQLLAGGSRVRLERRTRNPKQFLEQLAASGFSRFAYVSATAGADDENADDLEFRAIQ
ncbi:MAG TPA: ATP phosphoribosyltransferase regulatory subunit, partial [Galbitalea sp.]